MAEIIADIEMAAPPSTSIVTLTSVSPSPLSDDSLPDRGMSLPPRFSHHQAKH